MHDDIGASLSDPDYTFHMREEPSVRAWVRDRWNAVRYPWLTRRLKRYIPKTADRYQPNFILGEGVGIPRSWMARYLRRVSGWRSKCARILAMGCGTGWNLGVWLSMRPRHLLAVDLYDFRDAWQLNSAAAKSRGVKLEFLQQDAASLNLIEDGWADLVVSDAFLEHCRDLEGVVREMARITRVGGLAYASYGPLWFAPGGDHFSLRAGLAAAFNHLLLNSEEYQAFFRRNLSASEDVQGGGRYVPLDLFSKRSSREYLDLFDQYGLRRAFLAVEVSPQTSLFRAQQPGAWRALREKWPDLEEEDFFIKGHYVVLRRVSQ